MAIIPKQIGWSQESNLIWEILRQLDQLTKVVSTSGGGGGGGTNPTSTYIPYNNAGTFADSYLVNNTTTSVLKSVYGGNDVGLKLDFVNGDVYLGDPFGVISSNSTSVYMYVTPGSENIALTAGGKTYFSAEAPTDYCYVGVDTSKLVFTNGSSVRLNDGGSSYNGFEIIYNASLSDITDVKIGDYTNITTGTSIITDVTNSIIKTQYIGNDDGINLDFGLSTFKFGYLAGNENYIYIQSDDSGQDLLMYTRMNGSQGRGFQLNATTNVYDFGDTGGGAWISVDGNNNTIQGNTQALILDDAGTGNLITNSAGGNSGFYLPITINGTIYKIRLEDN